MKSSSFSVALRVRVGNMLFVKSQLLLSLPQSWLEWLSLTALVKCDVIVVIVFDVP